MNIKEKTIVSAIIAGVLLLCIAASVLLVNVIRQSTPSVAGFSNQNSAPTFVIASSTVFTLTTSSLRLLATSTPTKRLAATIQPLNCTTANSGVFMKADSDKVATALTGFFAFASTTFAFGDYPSQQPVIQGSVQGITSVGTCTVLVTEWRSQY